MINETFCSRDLRTGEQKEIEAREILDLIYILAKYPHATVPGLPLWINEYPRAKAVAKWAEKRNIPPDKALALMLRKESAQFGESILTSVANSGKDAGGFAHPDGRIELTSRSARKTHTCTKSATRLHIARELSF